MYASKDTGSGEFHKEWGVQDVERGVLEGINPTAVADRYVERRLVLQRP